MEGQGLTLKSALAVSGLGLLAWYLLFRSKDDGVALRNVKRMGVPPAPRPPAPLVVASMQAPSASGPKLVPLVSGKSHLLVKDVRALVAPQSMRMSGIESGSSSVAPYMAPQAGAGAVRIFHPGEEVMCSDADLADGCFYAAETETGADGSEKIVGYKRYTAGSPALLKSCIDDKPYKPDFDPYTGQAFSPRGEAIAAFLKNAPPAQAVSGSLGENFRDEPMSGHRYAIVGRKLPPSIERRIRAR
jgi:hypothetical protein